MNDFPRIRMFAGPNGSGKSTFKTILRRELLGVYINPDEMEKEIRDKGVLDLSVYQVKTDAEEILNFFKTSSLLTNTNEVQLLQFHANRLKFPSGASHAYFASVAADFIRQKLLAASQSFTFETVMSFPDKVELLQKAKSQGYRTYLYYIATKDPSINIARVQYRVSRGGHSVPEEKIVSRYHRSLDLLFSAVQATHRAYIFDNSGSQRVWLAEITNGSDLEFKTPTQPVWFIKHLANKFTHSQM
jgi:predicted ABC-type ATPase